MSTNHNCTVVVDASGAACGQPAVYSWVSSSGAVYHECADHAAPAVVLDAVDAVDVPAHPPTRTSQPFVLVRNGVIVGYAASDGPAVQKRAQRLYAAIVRVQR